ncbi:MAG: hypothetical protein A3E01_15370 [Gammaproteobacteria bacterium RIFCSPHIGHO2_12_FULL_63_22]|nr:MAG: hypothetical protein A3E01_15370 [Gammaproteobacteria bacterium RIFCSPHIGHO2_12_FULL_63_22]
MADVTVAAYDGTTDNGNVQIMKRNDDMPEVGTGLLGTGAALTAGQTFEIDVQFDDDVMIFCEDTSAGANSITLDAGDYPASPKASQGASTVAMVASDVVSIIPAKGRHLQSDGKITGSMLAAGRIWAMHGPAGFIGKAYKNATTSQDI